MKGLVLMIFFCSVSILAHPQKGPIKITQQDFTGTWEFGDKGWYTSIEVKSDTVILYDCMDGKQFIGIHTYWKGDTLFSVSNNLGLQPIDWDHPDYYVLINKNLLCINGYTENLRKRISSKPRKPDDCGFD